MRKIAIGVLSSIFVACPAFAQEKGFYLGGGLGSAISSETNQTYTPATAAGTTGDISTDHDLGLTGFVFAGYSFGRLRLEAEAGQISAEIDKARASFPIGTLASGSHEADGEVSARMAMVNVLVDIGKFDDVSVFIGGGVGVAEVRLKGLTLSSGPTVLDDKDTERRRAWQGIIGVRKPLASKVDLHVRYTYFNVDDAEMTGFGGRAVTIGLKSQSVVGGISYRF